MANIKFYKEYLGLNNIDDICKYLIETFLETNYTAQFFVDWSKVFQNRDKYKCELTLFQSLHGSSNIKKDFRALIEKYPEVTKIIPCAIAVREHSLKLIELFGSNVRYNMLNFTKASYNVEELNNITDFAEDSGLLKTVVNTANFADYILGIEVGLDSNARKNRSGFFLENMTEEILQNLDIDGKDGCILVKQAQFKTISSKYGINIPNELLKNKADFAIIKGNRLLNIEVNFYGGGGSKPSAIVGSFINRNRLLKSAGSCLVWLTEGPGWKVMQNFLHEGVSGIDYVINAEMLRHGALNKILDSFS